MYQDMRENLKVQNNNKKEDKREEETEVTKGHKEMTEGKEKDQNKKKVELYKKN